MKWSRVARAVQRSEEADEPCRDDAGRRRRGSWVMGRILLLFFLILFFNLKFVVGGGSGMQVAGVDAALG